MLRLKVNHDLELRSLAHQDAGELFTLVDRNRIHLRQWLPWVDNNQSATDTSRFIEATLKRADGSFASGVWSKARLAGVVDLHEIDQANSMTSIGYWLGQSFQGQGLMTQACHVLLDHAFNQLKLNRVEIRCMPQNYRSRAIPERLDFTQEGTLRQVLWLYDHFVDLVVYGILAPEWSRRQDLIQSSS